MNGVRFGIGVLVLWLTATMAPAIQAPPDVGPQTAVGPSASGGHSGSGTGVCLCTTSSCSGSCSVTSGNWEARIEGAAAGDIIVLQNGSYDPSGTLDIGDGTRAAPVKVIKKAGHNSVEIAGPVRSTGTGNMILEGVEVDNPSGQYTMNIQATTTPMSSVTIRYCSIFGGSDTALQLSGSLSDFVIERNVIDGGRDEHNVVVECLDATGAQLGGDFTPDVCAYVPNDITVQNNLVIKMASFPYAVTEDLMQLRGVGANVVVDSNMLSDNDSCHASGCTNCGQPQCTAEDCIDVKGPGHLDSTLVIRRNDIFANTTGGCRGDGILLQGQWEEYGRHIIVDRNYISSNDTGGIEVSARAVVMGNLFATATVVLGSSVGSDFTHNTMIDGTFKFGAGGTGECPQDLAVEYNAFDGTVLDLSGSASACEDGTSDAAQYDSVRSTVAYQTTGQTLGLACNVSCTNVGFACNADGDCTGCSSGCDQFPSHILATVDPHWDASGWQADGSTRVTVDVNTTPPRHGLATVDFENPSTSPVPDRNVPRPFGLLAQANYDVGADDWDSDVFLCYNCSNLCCSECP
jgi:hypothetical protein